MLKMFRRKLAKRRERALCRRIETSGWFDRDFYLAFNHDVAASATDPVLHFLRNGSAEGRSPSAAFDVPAYLIANPAAADANPVLDWLDHGAALRTPPQPIDMRHAQSLVIRLAPGAAPAAPAPALTREEEKTRKALRRRVADSGLFDAAYYLSAFPDVAAAGVDPLDHYLRVGHEEDRNPSPGFDTYFYKTEHRGRFAERDYGGPLAHYVEKGRAAGFAVRPPDAMTLKPRSEARTTLRVAVQLHLFYPEMAERFASLLAAPGFDYDLFVSARSETDAEFIRRTLTRTLPGRNVTIRVMPNRGRDVAPFLLAFPEIWRDYDVVLHLHSKRSPHVDFGAAWTDWILRHLLGDPAIAGAALRQFAEDPELAMVFPDNYWAVKRFAGWGGNEARIRALFQRLGQSLGALPRYAYFAAGSMGWYRCEVFAPVAGALALDDFDEEDGQLEGTLAHTLERALPLYALSRGRKLRAFSLDALPQLPPYEGLHARSSGGERPGDRWMRDTPAIAANRPRPLAPSRLLHDPRSLDIAWIIPDFALGAGGHMTIFRMVELLDLFGHRQTIWIQNARNYSDPEAALAAARRHYRPFGPRVAARFLPDDVRQLCGDVVIATDCWTAFPAATATSFKERFYFIQDYEPYFHPHCDNHLVAESTYRMGFAALCAGDWLLTKARAFGMWARKWDLASDPAFYFAPPPRGPRGDRLARIMFYNRGLTPRRAVQLGLVAFEELARRRRDFEVLMFGQPPEKRQYGFAHRELGILPPERLGELYREADVGVCFSTTNYSLIPLEMMACALPVVEIDADSTRVAFPEGVAALAAPDPVSVADAIERLLDDEGARRSQTAAAQRFVAGLDWKVSARAIEAAILDRLEEVGSKPISPAALAAPARLSTRKASVVIPTYNGGAVFEAALERVLAQTCDFDFDVLVIDSSSTDDTADVVRRHGGKARLHMIDKSAFQHGRTRNLAIAMTEGEFAALLTQDATPADDRWLEKLIGGFERGPRVAGVIGRHRAYPHHNPFVARDLDRMFDRFAELGPVFDMNGDLPSHLPRESVDWRMIMHFYSDNNSAMRRSLWRELPYPEIDWGEDQVWAQDMLRLGFAKAYVDDAVVFHSHDLAPPDQMAVGVHEGRLFAERFGLRLAPEEFDHAGFAGLARAVRLEATQKGLPVAAAEAYIAATRASLEGRGLGARMADDAAGPRRRSAGAFAITD